MMDKFKKVRIVGRILALVLIIKQVSKNRRAFRLSFLEIIREAVKFIYLGYSEKLKYIYKYYLLVKFINKEETQFLLKEVFDFEIFRVFTPKRNPVIVDIGGNIGIATLYLSNHFPRSTIHVFEPNPTSYKVLRENVSLNHISNIVTYEKAVTGKKHKRKKLFLPTENSTTSSFQLNFSNLFSQKLKTKYVESISLEELIKTLGHINILNIDAEGEEIFLIPEIIKLSDKIDMIIIEMHEFRDKPIYSLIQSLKSKYNTATRNLYDMEAVNNRLFQLNKNEPMLCFMLYGVAKRLLKRRYAHSPLINSG